MKNCFHKDIKNILEEGSENNIFTYCSLGFFYTKTSNIKRFLFSLNDEKLSYFFDLASLTKVLVTVPCLLVLLKKGKISLDDKMSLYFSNYGEYWGRIKIIDMVNHVSGLPAHRSYGNVLNSPINDIPLFFESSIFSEKPLFSPGKKVLYSDLGYILLGRIIEKISGMSLSDFWKITIGNFCELNEELFFIGDKSRDKIVPTGVEKGLVHDENCRFLGGIAGHAGLFGNCHGVLYMVELFMKIYHQEISFLPFSSKIFRDLVDNKVLERRCGFDVPTGKNPSCGKYFSDLTIGHLGFTGTSFWVDLRKKVGIVVLTNRTYCGEDMDKIKRFRPEVHNIIMKKILHI